MVFQSLLPVRETDTPELANSKRVTREHHAGKDHILHCGTQCINCREVLAPAQICPIV